MYKHLFFDLDHTIWDFDKNAEETLHELYHTYELKQLGLHSPDVFIETYTKNNHQLWADYHIGKISKEVLRSTRFSKTFTDLGFVNVKVEEFAKPSWTRGAPKSGT